MQERTVARVYTHIHHEIAHNNIVVHEVRVLLLGLEEAIEKVSLSLGALLSLTLHYALEAIIGGVLERGKLDGAVGVLAQ